MEVTRNGVYHDLNKSPYKVNINEVDFYFSSKFNMERFLTSYPKEISKLTVSLSNRFNLDFDATHIGLIRSYRNVEKRGFLIKVKGEKICLSNLKLDTQIKTKML